MSDTLERAGFEVDIDFLEIKDQAGHRHFFKRGDSLPGWVSDEQIQQLRASNALFVAEVI